MILRKNIDSTRLQRGVRHFVHAQVHPLPHLREIPAGQPLQDRESAGLRGPARREDGCLGPQGYEILLMAGNARHGNGQIRHAQESLKRIQPLDADKCRRGTPHRSR